MHGRVTTSFDNRAVSVRFRLYSVAYTINIYERILEVASKTVATALACIYNIQAAMACTDVSIGYIERKLFNILRSSLRRSDPPE